MKLSTSFTNLESSLNFLQATLIAVVIMLSIPDSFARLKLIKPICIAYVFPHKLQKACIVNALMFISMFVAALVARLILVANVLCFSNISLRLCLLYTKQRIFRPSILRFGSMMDFLHNFSRTILT